MATLAFVLFWILLGAIVTLAAMRVGRRAKRSRAAERRSAKLTYIAAGIAIAVFGVALPIVAALAGQSDAETGPSGVELTAAELRGRQHFADRCSQCHQLNGSAAVGRVGPNLDVLRPPRALILDAIRNGRARGQNLMPAQLLEGQEAQDTAAYIVKVAGR